jgi:predicted nucleic acid-binding protein
VSDAVAPDTSVVVAALCTWHANHDEARAALSERPVPIAHVVAETYSVLTRLPRGRRVAPRLVMTALERAFPGEPITLAPSAVVPLLHRLAAAGVHGGATYDALIAETARQAGLRIVTLDARACRTYEIVGAAITRIGTR